ncbi:NUDIX hydrolase [Candidatus Solirubrobacter pratensis]|uniref:NUDIX hydrolase n=1 Tax=Candidatus Solirubrobacter pratensis TaxID=1298857 RepID=UPI0004210493|nr:NUDIX hydrolase [Candidatus Solirubrobacter pratensis]
MAHGPEPGTILNEGEPTKPRQAATVIVLRGGGERLEVLLVQRTPKARFMGGAWVFPGGSVDKADLDGHRAAAVRELREEAGLVIGDPTALVPFARWITPPEVSIRFDTWFFLARAPEGQEADPDGQEIVDARWFEPARAIQGGEAGDLLLVFPTIKNLERLARFDSADALLEWAAGREVKPVQPRVEGQGEAARIVLDDEDAL